MQDVQTWILDFDGVVLESVALREQALADAFADNGFVDRQRVIALHRSYPGVHRAERIERIYRELSGSAPSNTQIKKTVEAFGSHCAQRLICCPIVSGLDHWLADNAAWPKYIVTAAPPDETEKIMDSRGLRFHFKAIFGAPDRKPDLLRRILEREKIQGKNAVFIGDRISDWQAACDASVTFWARVPSGQSHPFPPQVPIFDDFYSLPNPKWKKK